MTTGHCAHRISVLVLVVLSPTVTAAQSRDNVWLNIGWAVSSAGGSSSQLEEGHRSRGEGYSLGIGWALTDQLLIGLEANSWEGAAAVEHLFFDMANVSGTVTFFPSTSSGFFVKGGVGISDFGVGGSCDRPGGRLGGFPPLAHTDDAWESVFGGCNRDRLGRGIGLVAGAGYDIPLSDCIAITTAAHVWYGRPGTLELPGESLVGGWQQNVIDVSVGLTFR